MTLRTGMRSVNSTKYHSKIARETIEHGTPLYSLGVTCGRNKLALIGQVRYRTGMDTNQEV